VRRFVPRCPVPVRPGATPGALSGNLGFPLDDPSRPSRQNTLAAALKEWGTLRRTIHAAKYLSDPAYRRKIARQLNKGESLHALRRDLHYAQQGTIGKREPPASHRD
jgi:hypothetical protein